jgi:hypothetical protein
MGGKHFVAIAAVRDLLAFELQYFRTMQACKLQKSHKSQENLARDREGLTPESHS